MPKLTASNPAAFDVAQHVRESTLDAHRDAEERPFIVALLKGELTLDDYTRYLAQYCYVYQALEARAALSDGPVFDPNLARLTAIESDLAALGVVDRQTEHPPLRATSTYAAHLRALPPNDLARYLAHHYTRYLGDLSGGQVIARLVSHHYAATPEQLSFFRFDDIDDIVHYKRAYRAALNKLALSFDEVDALVEEVNAAYHFNSAIFDELAA
ncbi:biliverdin-producing heme oxygenase [Luethyella okanaganae]|uniref:Heme oxygenase (Biliverdin-producing) n=1 Tax=Luethyella okanaganae TaxID=69372 RepID=A0ABW1VD97_9MICO